MFELEKPNGPSCFGVVVTLILVTIAFVVGGLAIGIRLFGSPWSNTPIPGSTNTAKPCIILQTRHPDGTITTICKPIPTKGIPKELTGG